MALKKSDIRALIRNEDATNEEKISEILNLLHKEVDAGKDERDSALRELEETREQLEQAKSGEEWKVKYEEEHSAFEAYKADQEAKETRAIKEAAYRELLKSNGVVESSIDSILEVTKMDDIEIAEDGTINRKNKFPRL